MKLNLLTYFISEVNSAVDSGKYQDITIAEIEKHIEKGDLLPWLSNRLADIVDLSLFDTEQKISELTLALNDIVGGYSGHYRKKFGIEKSVFCLLIALVNEIIQRVAWDYNDPQLQESYNFWQESYNLGQEDTT